ncbi:MAG TPA: hypothetical protein ENK49_00790 [Gammaproteobacteria bacterium]|nr:hypothetical protein [Gammaproteobacteria bacterium]
MYCRLYLGKEEGEAWALSARERLRSKFLRTAEALGHHWQQAIGCYERALDIGDLAEDFYFHLMQCHHWLGRRAEAIQVYLRCKRMLQLSHSNRTEALYQALRQV